MRFFPAKKRHLVIALLIASLGLFGMYGALNLFGIWWRDGHSTNALDELYYATLDSRSENALAYNLITYDSYLSIVLPKKSEPVETMGGVKDYYSLLSEKPLKRTRNNAKDFLEATYSGATCYCCDEEIIGGENSGVSLKWYLDEPILYGWDYMDRARSKGVVFDVFFTLSKYHEMRKHPAATVEIEFKYDVEAKKLVINGDSFYVAKSGGSSDTNNPLRFLKRHGYDVEAMADDAIGMLKKRLLPAFLSRGGAVSRFSPDFEQDGVAVDVDLDDGVG